VSLFRATEEGHSSLGPAAPPPYGTIAPTVST
jgi:hypothetical protein